MLARFLIWFQGYLLVVLKGYSPERFLNLCSKNNILIWNLRKTEEGCEFYITVKNYKSIRPIVRKTKSFPLIKRRFGFPFILNRYKKRKIFFFGVALAVAIVYIMSLYIWDIEISGQYTHTEEAIIKFLNQNEVYAGTRKKNLNCQEIEEEIRKKYPDIGWVSAEIRGTRLLIKITETNMPKPFEESKEPCHIIANKDGIITSIMTRKGTPLVKEGDIVKKGDIVVSGVVDILGDDQTVVKKEAVIADADIIMKSFYNYRDEISLDYQQKTYSGRVKKYYLIDIFGKKLYILNPLRDYKSYKNYDRIYDEHQLKMNTNFYLPLHWGLVEYKEYETYPMEYTKQEAQTILIRNLKLYLEKLEAQNIEILEQKVTVVLEGKKCIATGKIIVNEPVNDTKKIVEDEVHVESTLAPENTE